jgi:hypothetical protein
MLTNMIERTVLGQVLLENIVSFQPKDYMHEAIVNPATFPAFP